jgi:hypothetical protein
MPFRRDRLLVSWPFAAATFAVLAALDLADIALYVGHVLAHHDGSWISNDLFSMNREMGLGEDVEYAKSVLAAVAAFMCGRRSGQPIFYVLSGINLWLAGDNAFRFHEQAGLFIGETLLAGNRFAFVKAQAPGELIYFMAFGLLVLALLAWGLWRTTADVVPTGLLLGGAVMSPGITGVFIDAAHSLAAAQGLGNAKFVIAEDGGETVMLSVSCALTLGCLSHYLGLRAAQAPAAATQG